MQFLAAASGQLPVNEIQYYHFFTNGGNCVPLYSSTTLIKLFIMCSFRFKLISLLTTILISGQLVGQTPFVKQVFIANSGKFEFAPPFEDFVTLQSTDPVSGNTHTIHSIGTQSAQDIARKGKMVYITAQDSLILIDADSYQRLGGIADSGLNKLLVCGNRLIISKQYPLETNFVEIRNTSDLSLKAVISGIPGDCGGMVSIGDSVYVAINGGWMGTEGKIAVIDTTNWSLSRIVNLGTPAIGMMSMYIYKGKIFTVNKSPFSSPDAGSISEYNPITGQFTNYVFAKNVATGAGIDGNLLYFVFNYGIASFNLDTRQLEDSTVIPDPGSASFNYITSAIVDTLNHRIFANKGDFFTPGTCLVYSVNGDSVTSWPTGISSDALLVDYRVSGTGIPEIQGNELVWMPNPSRTDVSAILHDGEIPSAVMISTVAGVSVTNDNWESGSGKLKLDVSKLPSGLYLVNVKTETGKIFRGKIIRE
jgi:hypothetical protein